MSEIIDIWTLPNVTLSDRKYLPNRPGIYFCTVDDDVLYIGMAINLQTRWTQHHRTVQLEEMGDVRIHWQTLDLKSRELKLIEDKQIDFYNPKLNGQLYQKVVLKKVVVNQPFEKEFIEAMELYIEQLVDAQIERLKTIYKDYFIKCHREARAKVLKSVIEDDYISDDEILQIIKEIKNRV